MTERAGRICALTILLLAVVSAAGRGAHSEPRDGRMAPWRIERDNRRFNAVATDNVMKLLGIRAGMTILDIGAGTGRFAREFSRRLNGTGMVYATDTNEHSVEYIRKEAFRRGLVNLNPVLVRKDGLDAFYGKQKYDLITVFHVSMVYEDQVDYFRELRRTLADGGRLVLILYKVSALFSPSDFTGDFREFLGILSHEPAGNPFYGILKDATRRRIRESMEAGPSMKLGSAIAADFNDALSDTRLAAHFHKGSEFRKELNLLPEEQRYADWVLSTYSENSVRKIERRGHYRKWTDAQGGPGERVVATINKLLILQRYRKYLKKDGLFLSGFTPSVGAAFEKAGYRLEGVYSDLIPFEDLVVFSSR